MSKQSKLDSSWVGKGTSKVKSCLTDYLTGVVDFRAKALQEIKEQIEQTSDLGDLNEGICRGLGRAVKIIENLKSQ